METVTTFVQDVGAIWVRDAFYFDYLGHTCSCWFKLLNIQKNETTVLPVQRKDTFG